MMHGQKNIKKNNSVRCTFNLTDDDQLF